MDIRKKTDLKGSHAGGFSLLEAVASVLILAMIVGGMIVAYDKTTDTLLEVSERTAAMAVAQRQMETLLDSRMEPNAHELQGQDEFEPRFSWRLILSREPIADSAARSAANTVIKATLQVESVMLDDHKPVELIRYLGSLDPLPGQSMAVPFEPEEAPWLEELREKLGREPTLDEIIQEMIRRGDMSTNMAAELGVLPDSESGGDTKNRKIPNIPEK